MLGTPYGVWNSISCTLRAYCDKGTMACAAGAISTGVQGYVTAWLCSNARAGAVGLHTMYYMYFVHTYFTFRRLKLY